MVVFLLRCSFVRFYLCWSGFGYWSEFVVDLTRLMVRTLVTFWGHLLDADCVTLSVAPDLLVIAL